MSEREQPNPGEGWRLVLKGEAIQERDEFSSFGQWFRVAYGFGDCVNDGHLPIRRRIPDGTPQPDLVNAPPHYRQGDIECIDAIRSALTDEEFRGYLKGNSMKYVWREKHKGGDQDLKKAAWYLNRIETKEPQ
jgi:hypothetical protein